MKAVKKDGWVLRYDSGAAVMYGQLARDFRGVVNVVEGGCPPQHPASTGRVWTDAGDYFPSVYGMKWVFEG